jgi:hypothetical protein
VATLKELEFQNSEYAEHQVGQNDCGSQNFSSPGLMNFQKKIGGKPILSLPLHVFGAFELSNLHGPKSSVD